MNLRERCPCGQEFALTEVRETLYHEQAARRWLNHWRERHRAHSESEAQNSRYRTVIGPSA